jgi:hypothetical protein
MSVLSFYVGLKPARRSILEIFNVFYSLYEPPEQPLETGGRANSRLLEFGTSHLMFQLVHDVMLLPISRSRIFPWDLSTERLRALVAYFGASV